MCTAASFLAKDFYFGRNLDLEYSYQETVTVTPRSYPFHFRNGQTLASHYALIGIATISEGYPLYYEATNEAGLSLAGLSFPGNAVYHPEIPGKDNIASFELIPWLLSQCATVAQAMEKIRNINIWNVPFNEAFAPSALHWLLADRESAVTIEPMAEGIKVSANPVGILTNNPPFEFHMLNLAQYMNLTSQPPENRFSHHVTLRPFSLGMGSIGLPGDMSSPSRFVKAAFTKLNSQCGDTESARISQFFHILSSIAQQRGLTCVGNREYEYTRYSCCCNTCKGIYYYTTYENSQITAVDMYRENLNGTEIISYPLIVSQQIYHQN